MNSVNSVNLENLINQVKLHDDEYEKDGITYCKNCNTPRSCKFSIGGEEKTAPIECDCQLEQSEAIEKAEKKRQWNGLVERCKDGIVGQSYRQMRFEKSDEELKWAKAYCKGFDEKYLKNSLGLMLIGQKGTGKTFAAACIANAIAEQGHRVTMANITWFVNKLSNFNSQDVLDDFNKSDLLIIDDFGAERLSDYVCEKIYSLIDSRYVSTLPLIITSNLSIQELKENKVLQTERMYDRIKQMCHPIAMTGHSRRVTVANDRYAQICEELGV